MSSLNIRLLTYNCARNFIDPPVFAPYIFASTSDILVLSLQELAPIGYTFLGGSFLTPYFNAFRHAVHLADKSYVNIISRNLGLTAIMIFVRDPQNTTFIQTAGVGVGVHEMGNKGAVGVRLDFSGVELTFVAAHLAPMEDRLERRNQDWKNIVKGLVFVPSQADQEDVPLLHGFSSEESTAGMFTPQSHLFFMGDLNYRASEVKPSPKDADNFPQPTEDEQDPRHYSHLLARDQLTQQLRAEKTLHGLTEAPITFPPTYKYNHPQTAVQDDSRRWFWAKHRWPSWCDRILYLDLPSWMRGKIEVRDYKALPLFATSDHRPVALSVSVPLAAIPEPPSQASDIRLRPPFSIDPDWKSRRDVARRKEIAVGLISYLGLTWEGNGLLLATFIGAFGGWLVIKSLLVV